MMFKIEITETVRYTEDKQEYHKLADSGNQSDGGAVYGYITKPKVPQTKEHIILKQEISDIDLVEIIKAINGID